LLDARRHLGGPLQFNAAEAAAWGVAVQQASQLVQQLTGCDRVYAIAFGEGARHLHLHLIPRFSADPTSEAWKVADLYRAVATGERPPASATDVQRLVCLGRGIWLSQQQAA
jgi:diadenosine tetraphosphate (Ap4A) HIT family hydrolase